MKKMFLLSVMLVGALTVSAQDQRPYGNVVPQKGSYLSQRFQGKKAVSPTAKPAAPKFNVKRNAEIIDQQPAGRLMLMKRSGIDVMPFYGTPTPADYDNKGTYVVMGDDGNVYFKSYVTDMANGGTWVKGTKNGDLVTISLPQVSCHLWFNGSEFTYYLYAMKKITATATDEWTGEEYTYQTWEPDSSVTSISYRMADDGSMTLDSSEPDSLLLGGVLDEDGSWPGSGDMNCSFEPFDETPNTLPAGTQLDDYVFGNYSAYGEKSQRLVKGAVKDDTLYVTNFSTMIPQSVMKAKIDGDKATVITNQFLGVDSVYSTLCYLKASSYDLQNDEGWITVYNYNIPEMTFNYDATQHLFAADTNALVVNAGKGDILLHECYLKPFFKQYFEQPATPANPEWVAYMAYNEQSQWGYACFDLYSQDKEGNYINPDNLYYRVYLDDDSEPYEWTLTAADGSTYNTTDVPYAYIDDDFIGGGSTYHVFYYYMGGFENMGLQAVYDSDGEERTSDIVWSTTLGVKDVKANAAKGNTTYWNLAGSRVAAPGQGIYIMRTQNADGTVSTKKVMHK